MGFQSKHLPSASEQNGIFYRIAVVYRRRLAKSPFLFFGLPFLGTIVAGSFFLTPATAIRYEKHDRKVRRMSQEEAMGLGADRRKVDMKDEYYVSPTPLEWEEIRGVWP